MSFPKNFKEPKLISNNSSIKVSQIISKHNIFTDSRLTQLDLKQLNENIDKKIQILQREHQINTYKNYNTSIKEKNSHQCQKCECSGSSECNKKIQFLQGRIKQYLNIEKKKQISQIYDVEKLGLDNQYYLVQYTDNTLQKMSVKYIKQYYLHNYAQFLQNYCFKE